MRHFLSVVVALCLVAPWPALAQQVPLKNLGRFAGWRENALVGYGLVTGLSGSGDTRRSVVTRQALRNVLSRLGTSVSEDDISSRNVAVVMVTAVLPPSANVGDRIDVIVSSIGDARSLAGGTLIMTPLLGPDQRPYALAQGPLLAGGYRFESELNQQQRNYPTSAVLPGGATIETSVQSAVSVTDGELSFLLANPSFSTAQRIAERISGRLGAGTALARNADEVRIRYAGGASELTAFVANLENVLVEPDSARRVVINERTGTVVAGSEVMISSVAIAQGDIKVTVTAENYASQPSFISGFASDVRSLVVTNTKLEVSQGEGDRTFRFPNTSVADLVQALTAARVDTRRIISILQAIKAAGALHADIIVQ
ncbi:flagellar basal body P-ring protein FlgI [Sphingomonas sp. BT-65]|uniref:flagellar basal body P-ring protein FlgI n=1 Tax=Sphingomonas sp. BT-65 TaxID=2989821 RepID=UPI002235567A|nr:flagellar basal body P-ring protein FlgI [Sphingomonas sp. BT-65]MCW4463790.1 flagellar basal body P-ring protein FlgI [Sphingomonas sp. BT-65]